MDQDGYFQIGLRACALWLATGVLAAFALLAASAGVAAAAPSAQTADSSDPLEGVRFYVDHETPSWLAWKRASGRQKELLWKIAREPKSLWYGPFTRPASQFYGKVRRPIDIAEAQGTVPLLTIMRAHAGECHPGYMGGGFAEDRRTRAWYDKFARAVGNSRVIIAFEPDSLGTIRCQARSRRDDRKRLLRYGVSRLAKLPNATVYIEAGASDWMPPGLAARLLREVGVGKVRGFMLNATHQDWTAANVRHGLAISRRLGGKHFVINTAENGRGPFVERLNGRRHHRWCNAPGRGLGPAPTTDTMHPLVDAYLWINRPGYGQSCAGQKIDWNLPRALAYASRATSWVSSSSARR